MRQADLDRVVAIERETLSPWSLNSLEQELLIAHGIQGVAETSDLGIIGWCACREIWPEAELLKITVQTKSRQRGVGDCLLAWLISELQRKKVANLFLEVRSQNHPALKFYKKNGFLQVGERPNYYSAPRDNALIFKKDILW